MSIPWLVFIESNTSGTGRLFAGLAHELGFRPVLLTSDSARYKYAAEDGLKVIEVDTQVNDALLETCRKLACESELAGVTSSSEYFIETAATVASELGLPGPNPAAIRSCRDKHAQRVRLKEAGVGTPAFSAVSSKKAAVEAARRIGLPVVVKPVSGSGSVGVKLCYGVDEVAAHAGVLLRQRHNERGLPIPRRILVEEMAVGPEYSVETFGARIIGITKKHLGPLPHFVEVGHDYPAELPVDLEAAITETVSGALAALGLDWGPAHCELRVTAQGVKIIEINPRLAGGYIPELVRLAQGINLIAESIRATVGLAPRLDKTLNKFASLRFLLPPNEGILASVEGLDAAGQITHIAQAQLYKTPGHELRAYGDFRDRVGHVIAVCDTSEAARSEAQSALGMIRLNVNTIPN